MIAGFHDNTSCRILETTREHLLLFFSPTMHIQLQRIHISIIIMSSFKMQSADALFFALSTLIHK